MPRGMQGDRKAMIVLQAKPKTPRQPQPWRDKVQAEHKSFAHPGCVAYSLLLADETCLLLLAVVCLQKTMSSGVDVDDANCRLRHGRCSDIML